MIFFASDWNKTGKGVRHKYRLTARGKIVVDEKTGLMWQQSGSSDSMPFEQAEKYVAEQNRENFGGFGDWRLPTLEEGMSLMEPEKQNNDLYIDRVFNKKQRRIWTSDKESASCA